MVTQTWGEFAYAPPGAVDDGFITPERDEAHHLFRVRRIAAGSHVWVTDGAGSVHECEVMPDYKLQILQTHSEYGESRYPVILALAMLRNENLREAVDTAVQLGVTRLILFSGERSEIRIAPERLERLHRVLVSSIKQCGRARLPVVESATGIANALEIIPTECTRYIAHPISGRAISGLPPIQGAQALFIGPEGGFSDHEAETAIDAGCIPLTLAPRRLRSETAVAAGLTLLQGAIRD